MTNPENHKYLESHEWIDEKGGIVAVGVSDQAQSELSVELPEIGRKMSSGDAVAVVESMKAANDIYAPVTGEIMGVNTALAYEPSKINSDA